MTTTTAVQITEARSSTGAPVTGGRMLVQLIDPGWGSSGYYSPAVLETAAANRVFPAGTHLYIDHPTATEDAERPERSVRDLAAVLEEDARVGDGSSLVATARILPTYRQVLAEAADAIGLSIRASARVTEGEAEGRRGLLVDELVEGLSVDFVTKAGRGGRILEVLESARAAAAAVAPVELPAVLTETGSTIPAGTDPAQLSEAVHTAVTNPPVVTAGAPPPAPTPETTEESMGTTQTGPAPGEAGQAEVTEARTRPISEADRLQQLLTERTSQVSEAYAARDAAIRRAEVAERRATLVEARSTVERQTRDALAASALKEAAWPSVINAVCDGIALDDQGRVDEAKVAESITAEIERKRTEVAALLEAHGVGVPRDLGGVNESEQIPEVDLEEAFLAFGLSESTAKLAANVKG